MDDHEQKGPEERSRTGAPTPATPPATRALSPTLSMLLGGAGFVVIILGIRAAASFIAPLLLAMVISIAVYPILARFMKWGLSPLLSWLLTLIVTVLILVGLVTLLAVSLAQAITQLPSFADQLAEKQQSMVDFLQGYGINLSDLISNNLLSPERIMSLSTRFLNSMLDLLSGILLITLAVCFMLIEATGMRAKIMGGSRLAADSMERVERFTRDIRAFISVTTLTGAGIALVNAVFLFIIDIRFAVLWGLFSFFMNYIPNIGFIIALVPPTLLAFIEHGWIRALIVVVGYFAINGAVDNLLKPKIMGEQTDLSILTVFFSVALWGWALGPLGGLLAVPLTLMAKRIFIEGNPEAAWLAVFMGQAPKKPRARRRWLRRTPHGDAA